MKIFLLPFLVLSLASLACYAQGTVLPENTPQTGHRTIVGDFEASTHNFTSPPITATVTAYSVYVRFAPDSASHIVASLIRGQVVKIAACAAGWCELVEGGYVWQGCLSNAPVGVGCDEAK
jgi:hypothetical protein